jgi:hypothetical protein
MAQYFIAYSFGILAPFGNFQTFEREDSSNIYELETAHYPTKIRPDTLRKSIVYWSLFGIFS